VALVLIMGLRSMTIPDSSQAARLAQDSCPGLFSWNESSELFGSRPFVDNGLNHPAVATTRAVKRSQPRGAEDWSRLCQLS
jgi:hypothetical protein